MTTHSAHGLAAQIRLPAAGSYEVDPARSSATFTTRHLFGLAEVTGSMALVDGQVTIAADPVVSTVRATLASASFESASAGRDAVVASPRFLDAEAHPHLTFTSTSLVPDGQGWLVRGALTVRGASAPLDLTVTEISEDRDEVTVRATATVDRHAHGLTRAKGLAARRLQLQLTAVATRT